MFIFLFYGVKKRNTNIYCFFWGASLEPLGSKWSRPCWVAAGFLHWLAVASSGASTANAATQEALVEAAVKAKWLGCCRILFMSSSKRVAQVCNFSCTPSWQEKNYDC